MPDNPYPAPPPVLLAQMLRMQAWRDDIDDDSRILHEQSAEVIEELIIRNGRQAHLLETLEAARQ
jgi:hypothetical protein